MRWHNYLMSDADKLGKETPTPAQLLLAANLRALIDSHETLNSPPKLSQASGVDSTMINRILRCDNAASVKTLEAIAGALGVPVWRLHVPADLNELAAWTIQALQQPVTQQATAPKKAPPRKRLKPDGRMAA
jgi:transcriptional regulator with XRE-family HTH domain